MRFSNKAQQDIIYTAIIAEFPNIPPILVGKIAKDVMGYGNGDKIVGGHDYPKGTIVEKDGDRSKYLSNDKIPGQVFDIIGLPRAFSITISRNYKLKECLQKELLKDTSEPIEVFKENGKLVIMG